MRMKHLFFLSLLLPAFAFSHNKLNEFDYSIIFIGSFENDIVSLTLNNTLVLDKYAIDNSDSLKKGHLSLTQYDNEIKVFYNGTEITRSRIAVEFILDAEISINDK